MKTENLINLTKFLIALLMSVCVYSIVPANAQELTDVKIGVLKFGTVNWELDVIREHNLDKENGVKIHPVLLGNKNATAIALQGKEVDIIVSDWIWVTRQRAAGKSYTFFPYSNAVGGILVHPDSEINNLEGLKGKRLGIAGGPVDKSWLLYRALSKKRYDFDLSDEVDAKFAAPPLLNKLMVKKDRDAVIRFWEFGARLKAAGMVPLISVPELLPELGVKSSMPLLGWVFDSDWAEKNPKIVAGIIKASYAAKRILQESDEEWVRLAKHIKPKTDDELQATRNTYRAGIPTKFGEDEIEGAKAIFSVLAKHGGKKLVGESTTLDQGTFWGSFEMTK